jgi:Avidin family
MTTTRDAISLTGTWHNQLGSQLDIEVDELGNLTGRYRSPEGLCPDSLHTVVGLCDLSHSSGPILVGFVVRWSDAGCITSWSGQYFPDSGEIKASWLMTSESAPRDEWKATIVGHDVFHR